ncbi:hypothetical protein ACFLY5_00760 [Patescibacteria group bacterium]
MVMTSENIEQAKEKIEPKKYFKELVDDGLKYINTEEIYETCKKRGVSEEDTDIAIEIMACIASLDDKIINREKERELSFCFGKTLGKEAAGYFPKEKGKKEGYGVFPKNMKHRPSPKAIISFDEQGNLDNPENTPKETRDLHILGLAVHEIRHRVQKTEDFSQFTPADTSKYKDEPFSSYIRFMSYKFEAFSESIVKKYRKDGKPEEYIKDRTSNKEFDAQLIEELAKSKLHSGITEKELLELIQLQPTD